MADNRTFEEIVNSYPGLREHLVDVFKRYVEVMDLLKEMDKEYPVDGWAWDIDINRSFMIDDFKKDPCLENTMWTMYSMEKRDEDIKIWDARYQRQMNCTDRKHEWVNISRDIRWCKYCGSIEIFDGTNTTVKSPDYPHFVHHE